MYHELKLHSAIVERLKLGWLPELYKLQGYAGFPKLKPSCRGSTEDSPSKAFLSLSSAVVERLEIRLRKYPYKNFSYVNVNQVS